MNDAERVIAESLAVRYGWKPCSDSSTPVVTVDARRVLQALTKAGYEVVPSRNDPTPGTLP